MKNKWPKLTALNLGNYIIMKAIITLAIVVWICWLINNLPSKNYNYVNTLLKKTKPIFQQMDSNHSSPLT